MQWRGVGGTTDDVEERVRVLVGVALAVALRSPAYATDLVPRPAPRLVGMVLEQLGTELIQGWEAGTPSTSTQKVLQHLVALGQVREALEADPAWGLGTRLSGPDGFDIMTGVVHDLRSPLTSILFLAETLQHQRSGAVNELQRRQLGLIYSAALGLSVVVGDALELLRGGQLVENEPDPLSIAETLEGVRDIVRAMAEEKGLAIQLLGPEQDRRLGHPVALSRVLLNLTTNALKFTHQGHVDITAVATSPTRVEFSVRDTGPGIGPWALANLYEPLHRTRERSGYRFSSTGLGLAMTRRLVAAMKSQLHLETRQGWGTRFFFELEMPLAPAF